MANEQPQNAAKRPENLSNAALLARLEQLEGERKKLETQVTDTVTRAEKAEMVAEQMRGELHKVNKSTAGDIGDRAVELRISIHVPAQAGLGLMDIAAPEGSILTLDDPRPLRTRFGIKRKIFQVPQEIYDEVIRLEYVRAA